MHADAATAGTHVAGGRLDRVGDWSRFGYAASVNGFVELAHVNVSGATAGPRPLPPHSSRWCRLADFIDVFEGQITRHDRDRNPELANHLAGEHRHQRSGAF